jgi:para-aminobenzoate synthetase/4-amino-4-deoxychorismate lyase
VHDPADIVVLLDDSLDRNGVCTLFRAPVEVVHCDAPVDVEPCLARVTEGVEAGLFAAGFFAYELGYVLEPRLEPLLPADRHLPLIWMGLFEAAERLPAAEAGRWIDRNAGGGWAISEPRPTLDRPAYDRAFARVRDFIAAGDVYQINLTFKYRFAFEGDPLALYRELRRRQPVAHGGFVAASGFQILSLSPELFVRIADGRIEARPMKGTAGRGPTTARDTEVRRWLAADPKSRAENLMIVDLLRNDLGRIAAVGSVRVTDLFTVESFPTVHQMTSGITARLRPGIGVAEIVRRLFPSGSVTGAPKIRAMEIIRDLELEPRGVYTGAIGMIAPGGRLAFNVAIRTLTLTGRTGELGVGGGLLHDSDVDAEYEECRLKARFLTEPRPVFSLIETMRWDRDRGYALLDRHLARFADSADYFGFVLDLHRLRAALRDQETRMPDDCCRVRVELDAAGVFRIGAEPLDPAATADGIVFVLSPVAVRSDDPFLYHKTSHRPLYGRERARLAAATGCDEVIFVNERGELTEGTWTNLFVECGGRLATPALSCGLLDGTLRRELLETEPERVREAILRPADLVHAERIFLGNSVRGLMPAVLLSDGPKTDAGGG